MRVPRLSLLVIILTFELLHDENFCECKVKGQMIKPFNASIRKGREPGNKARFIQYAVYIIICDIM